MSRVVELTVNALDVEALTDKLGRVDDDTLAQIATESVNTVATHAYDTAKQRMTSTLSLTEQYVSRKMEVGLAKPSTRPRATVTANGMLTTLGHYGATVLAQPVKHPERSKGHAAIGLAKGEKRAGVSVEVRRGNRKVMGTAFTLPGKNDREGNPLVFIRAGGVNRKTGKPKVENLYGPSVYQLFNTQIRELREGIETDLFDTLINRADEVITKALS